MQLIMACLWTLLSGCSVWMSILVILCFIPSVYANPLGDYSFPHLTFKEFSDFILATFPDTITLQTTLIMLFSLLENPDIIALHARHRVSLVKGENKYKSSAWMNAFSCALLYQLKQTSEHISSNKTEYDNEYSNSLSRVSGRMERMAKLLQLWPYYNDGHKKTVVSFSSTAIQPTYIICPSTNVCETSTCKPYGLQCTTRDQDAPQVHLIKGSMVYNNAYVYNGQCNHCKVTYTADSEHDTQSECYVNSAKYLKLGAITWADRIFCAGVVNGMYSFHASTGAYMDYWNNTYTSHTSNTLSQQHIWQAFVQQSIRMIASDTHSSLVVENNISVERLTWEAFHHLGLNGIIKPAQGHMCNECTQEYKEVVDELPQVGQVRQQVEENNNESNDGNSSDEDQLSSVQDNQVNFINPVQMVVVDGIVMGALVSNLTYFIYNILTV